MARLLLLAVGVVGGLTGCADTWEMVSSRKFKSRPFQTMFQKDDPLHVLRTSSEGSERATAMLKLREPLAAGGSQADQDEVVDHILGPAATSDPSPVVRAAAIDALSRFKDPRCPQLLTAAYYQASGRPTDPNRVLAQPEILTTNAKEPGRLGDRQNLTGPTGFSPETATMLRAKSLDGLARTGQPDAVAMLARIATGEAASGEEKPDRETRLAAVRGLAVVRQKESVPVLAKILATEAPRDTGLASRAHEGLVTLTGKNLPADPTKWNEVVQTGYEVSPDGPTLVERTVGSVKLP